jgi:hypothetical protein
MHSRLVVLILMTYVRKLLPFNATVATLQSNQFFAQLPFDVLAIGK